MFTTSLLSFLLISSFPSTFAQKSSSKRGLVYVAPDADHPREAFDARFWDSPQSDLTWYYNYQSTPATRFNNATKLQFVPQLWGAPSDENDMTFYNDVKGLIDGGKNVSYVLAFNEPDGYDAGGSHVDPELAARTWIREIEPLKKMGVKLGAPAVTGAPGGFTWLQKFFTACAGNCSADFIPVHWYGNFEGLASHIGQVNGTYKNMTMWVTEYALNDASLEESQAFYNQSADFLDKLEYVFEVPISRRFSMHQAN